jgi:hypothetical protein
VRDSDVDHVPPRPIVPAAILPRGPLDLGRDSGWGTHVRAPTAVSYESGRPYFRSRAWRLERQSANRRTAITGGLELWDGPPMRGAVSRPVLWTATAATVMLTLAGYAISVFPAATRIYSTSGVDNDPSSETTRGTPPERPVATNAAEIATDCVGGRPRQDNLPRHGIVLSCVETKIQAAVN